DSSRDYTYVDDIVSGVIASLDRPRQFAIYNLGNSSPTELNELIELIERAAGRNATRRHLPDQPGDVPITYADISRARRELGFEPKTDLWAGIEKFVRWYEKMLKVEG